MIFFYFHITLSPCTDAVQGKESASPYKLTTCKYTFKGFLKYEYGTQNTDPPQKIILCACCQLLENKTNFFVLIQAVESVVPLVARLGTSQMQQVKKPPKSWLAKKQ